MEIDPKELHVGGAALRKYVDATGYGNYISDAITTGGAAAVIQAVEQWRAGVNAVNKPKPLLDAVSKPSQVSEPVKPTVDPLEDVSLLAPRATDS